MTAKEFLQQYRDAEDNITAKLDQIHKLRELATKTTQVLTPDRVQSSGEQNKTEAIVSKIVDMEHEVDTEIDQFREIKQRVQNAIASVPDLSQRKVLTLRYINGFHWEKIAVKLNYHYRSILKIHGRALQEIQKRALKCT